MATSKQPYGGHVRVRLPNGAESTVGAAYAARHGLTVLEKKDAHDRNGRPARAKARTEKGDKAGTRKVNNDTPATTGGTTTATTSGTTTTKEA